MGVYCSLTFQHRYTAGQSSICGMDTTKAEITKRWRAVPLIAWDPSGMSTGALRSPAGAMPPTIAPSNARDA